MTITRWTTREGVIVRLRNAGCPKGTLAKLVRETGCKFSAPKLSDWFKGRIELDHATRKQLERALKFVTKLAEDSELPVDFHSPRMLALWSEFRKQAIPEAKQSAVAAEAASAAG